MADPPVRDTFVAFCEARIAAWTTALESYRAAQTLDATPIDGSISHGAVNGTQKAIDLPVGVFRDKSLREAITILLESGRRKQLNKDIAAGLQKGGFPTTSVNFEATVGTALSRMKDDGLILRFPDGWDLAASYPESLRARLEKDSKPAKRAKAQNTRTKSAKAPKAKKAKSATGAVREAAMADKTALILGYIVKRPQGTSVDNIADYLKQSGIEASRDYVRVVTKRLKKRGQIDIVDGQFVPMSKGTA